MKTKIMEITSCVLFAIMIAVIIGFNFCSYYYQFYIVVICVIIGIIFLLKYLDKFGLFKELQYNIKTIKHSRKVGMVGLLSFVILLSGGILYWLAYYPGGFNLDAYGQWDQAHGLMQLNNWHPIITTLWYKILISIHDSLSFCILIHIILFSVISGIVIQQLYEKGLNFVWCIIISVAIAMNPAVQMNNVCLVKDVPFCFTIMWNLTMLIEIYCSKGNWFSKKRNIISFVICNIVLLLVRHNGLFYVVPEIMLIEMFYQKNNRRLIVAGILTFATVITIQGPVYKWLNVEPHSNVIGEMTGVPMSIMANALVSNTHEPVPMEVREFLLEIADEEEWKSKYIPGEWDSCRWDFGGTELLKDEAVISILLKTIDTVQSAPQASYESFRENTRMVWQLVGECYWEPWIYIEENHYDITARPNVFLNKMVTQILNISKGYPTQLFVWNLGIIILLYLFLFINVVFSKQYEKLLFIIPLLIYIIGTTFLLCGPNQRYFYFNWVVVAPVFFICFSDIKEKEADLL